MTDLRALAIVCLALLLVWGNQRIGEREDAMAIIRRNTRPNPPAR